MLGKAVLSEENKTSDFFFKLPNICIGVINTPSAELQPAQCLCLFYGYQSHSSISPKSQINFKLHLKKINTKEITNLVWLFATTQSDS